ncbi:HlyD family efflux transporter periplasmic adaptor subunit [Pseudorhodoferax sp.]|uniref:HlyD family efflux transporter periplasmic adaptor subunit n=1 Tax=Pseudorhodoferax sp. TaxID=1993553 RepID=UPI002DD6A576|nr:HlyD family efflux transporter periplasmic adaptor subunit [Pseudorhodoferax sp.]
MNTATTTAAASEPAAPSKRKKALTAIAAVVVVAGLGLAAYEWLVASHYEETDNAYVQGNLVQITPQIGGTVMAILADDTDRVQAGQPLVQLDPADGRVALEQAEAQLAQTVRQVRTLYANNGALSAQVALRDADITRARTEIGRAQSEVARANDDLNRRQALTGNGAVSREELHHAQTTLANTKSALAAAEAGVQSAQAAAAAAREQLASNQSMTEGTSVEQHPSVLAAAAKVREAWLATQRAALPAPVSGYVAKRSVQLGQRVAAGTPLMSVVPLDQLWVDANFKEVQLRNIRIGQPVRLTADVYGKKVEYKGQVSGLGVGTGAAFALLPAQNATGNWIKVVQRVPVRIALDPQQVVANPLRVGLSMDVTVDVTQKDGRTLAEAPRSAPVAATAVYASDTHGADEQVRRVIAANIGPAVRGSQAPVARAPARAGATQTAQAAH